MSRSVEGAVYVVGEHAGLVDGALAGVVWFVLQELVLRRGQDSQDGVCRGSVRH